MRVRLRHRVRLNRPFHRRPNEMQQHTLPRNLDMADIKVFATGITPVAKTTSTSLWLKHLNQ